MSLHLRNLYYYHPLYYCTLKQSVLLSSTRAMLWQCYDAVSLGVVLAILWHRCSATALLQSKCLMLYAMLQSRLVCTKACHATEWALLAMDAYLAAEETPCNPVCLATEQAVIAVPQACLALLVGMSCRVQRTVLWKMVHATMVAAGALQRQRTIAPAPDLPTRRGCTSATELYYLQHHRSCAATACASKGGHSGPTIVLEISGVAVVMIMLQHVWLACLWWLRPLAVLLQSCRRCVWLGGAAASHVAATLWHVLLRSYCYWQGVAQAWVSPLELAACFQVVEYLVYEDRGFTVRCEMPEPATFATAVVCLGLRMVSWHAPLSERWCSVTCRVLSALCMQCLSGDCMRIAIAFIWPTFGKRAAPTSPATEQTSGTAVDPEAMTQLPQDTRDAPPPESTCSGSAPYAATEHIAPASRGSTTEAPPCSGAASHHADTAITSLDDVVSKLALLCDESAVVLCSAARTVQRGVQAEIRRLCTPWGVHPREKKATGKYGNRSDSELKAELTAIFLEKAKERLRAKASVTQQPDTASVATERASPEFSFEGCMAEALHRIKAISGDEEIMARIVDHACDSQACISRRIAVMCEEANWETSTDLCNDQPIDACGYIAADVVCRLRDTALAEGSRWHHIQLPDYAQLKCIDRGNKVLRKTDDDRNLDSDQVNLLVRHYAHLDQRHQAAEEWWGGAVALDHFLTGLPGSVEELSTSISNKQHRWRAWVVNTQTSRQLGSHWFTVAVGTRTQLLQSTAEPGARDANSPRPATDYSASSRAAGRQASGASRARAIMELPDSSGSATVERDSSSMEPEASAASLSNYPNLFDTPGPVITDVLTWAHANATQPRVAAWLEACSQWDAAVETKEHRGQKKRRKLCKDHGIPCTKVVDTNDTIDAAMEHVRRELCEQIQQIRTQPQMPEGFGTRQSNHPPKQRRTAEAEPLLQSEGSVPPRSEKRSAPINTEDDPPYKRTEAITRTLKNYFTPLLQSEGSVPPRSEKRSAPINTEDDPPYKRTEAITRTLKKYFTPKDGSVPGGDVEKPEISTVATDVRSTYCRLRAKRDTYAEDTDFQIVTDALDVLRSPINRQTLHERVTNGPRVERGSAPAKRPKTVREHFTGKNFSDCRFPTGIAVPSRTSDVASFQWRTYHVKLLVLAQARRWLSATERLDAIEDSPPTPKTISQLATAMKHDSAAEYLPYGSDFEDPGAYSPTICRLLAHAEIHKCRGHDFGTFSQPRRQMPYTYRQMQEWIVDRRRQQAKAASDGATGDIVKTAEDLATRLQEFACDAVVVKHLIEFALPQRQRTRAAEVTTKEQPTVRELLQQRPLLQSTSATASAATEDESDVPVVLPTSDTRAQAATEHQRDQPAETGHTTAAIKNKPTDYVVTLSRTAAEAMATKFLQFVTAHNAGQSLNHMSAGQVVVLCIFHSRLSWQKGKPIELNDRDQHWIPKPIYTPASAVNAPSPPHFVQLLRADATERSRPQIQPPRVCCLCGKGFVDAPALWRHCEADHHSWAEARKRMLWEAEKLESIPLLPSDKRRIVQNFTAALTYSRPAAGHFGRDKVCMRQLVGCATCARVAWIDHCFPCFLFKECPESLQPKPDDSDDEAREADDSSDEEMPATERSGGTLLKDEDGYYVADPHKIHQLLDVSKYIEAWPLIPIEELHASSVQHPTHPRYRWLLNTRRVPVCTPDQLAAATEPGLDEAVAATEHALPKCAGVGSQDEPVWLCKSCTQALCRPEPVMPFFALANWNWGGRVHPLYYNLSIAMKALLGLAIMVCRMIALRYSEHEEDQEKGFVGNTILLTQPSPEEVIQKLPPPDSEASKYLSVCFNSKTMTKEDVGKHRALQIDPEQYIKCIELRQRVCPVFAQVEMDADQVKTQWPETGVPQAIILGAQGMDTLHTFNPTLDGPASMRASTCTLPTDGNDREVIDDDDDDHAVATERGSASGDPGGAQGAATERALGSDAATEHVDSAGLPLDLPAEFLIGVQENEDQDPVDRMLAVQKLLELIHEKGKTLNRLEQRRQQFRKSSVEDGADAAAQLAAEKASFTASLVEVKRLTSGMGEQYHAQMLEALRSSRMQGACDNTGKTLHIKSGKPMNMFEAPAWAAAFVEFLYGDCAPNLDRPQKVGVRELFDYLASREELEYSLASDREDPLIPGGCYRAPAQSRWNTPEFMAIFADVVRKIRILQTSSLMWTSDVAKWKVDIKEIAKCSVAQFEQLSTILAQHGQQSMQEMMRAAVQHKLLPVFKALMYLTFQTANIPLTQGYKVSLRQLGFGLNVYDGPLTVFLTTNFADMFSPISVTLMNGAGEALGRREVNLLQSAPCMPTPQAMHRALAKHPYIQVRLFLLLDELVHTELLCTTAFIGQKKYGMRDEGEPTREDDFASTGEIGIAHFVRSALKPLEAQGRGFSHGHEKVISVPRTRAARLKQLFAASATEHRGDELSQWCEKAREAVLRAASTLQYDSAVLPGAQLGVALRPEPFTNLQQKRSRYDGQVEEADDNAPLRPLIPVTGGESNGHLKHEEARAVAEQRPMRHPYKQLPLTGATQSLMPMYRLSTSFGRIEIPDEFGYYPDAATGRTEVDASMITCNKEFEVQRNGEVTGFCLPNGEPASAQELQADCDAWATSFARDQRGSFIQNHDHDCTATCVKHEKKQRAATELPQRCGQKISGPGVPKCRFRFFRYVGIKVADVIKYVIRRGKKLVERAFVATGNEENEFGKAVVVRGTPFRSSSSDVLQATIRCNADYQYQKRAVPDIIATEQEPNAPARTDTGTEAPEGPMRRLLVGCGGGDASNQNQVVLAMLATAMRAANIVDFYITKYLSKPQQALGPTIQPFIAGARRTEAEESAPGAPETTVTQRAKKRLLRFIFCANRTLWFSACELGIFLATGSSCVHTEPTVKVFSGKGIAMMHECKRQLNHSVSSEGLLCAARAAGRNAPSALQAFLVAPAEDAGAQSEAESHATEDGDGEDDAAASSDEGCHVTEPALRKRRRSSPTKQSTATEHASFEDDDCDPAIPDVITAPGSHNVVNELSGKAQLFTKSTGPRDDWLHRGPQLRDMDYYHYARYVDRIDMPRKGEAAGFQRRAGVYFVFDAHYAPSRHYVQVLRKYPHTVQNVGPQCQRSDVNRGEDNAIYNAFFFSCIRCTGADECANPLMCQPLLYPQDADIDRHLALLQSAPEKQPIARRFAPAWKARRYEIDILADRAAEKQNNAQRIGVIHDTTTFKGVRIPRRTPRLSPDDDTERVFETRMEQIIIQQVVRRAMGHGTCLERVMQLVIEYMDLPLPWHPDQPHLAEWQAYSAREITLNLNSSVDARNSAQKQAAKRKSQMMTEADDADAQTGGGPMIIIEDLGAPPADDLAGVPDDIGCQKHRLQLPPARVMHVLARTAEREMAGQVGRPRDMHKEMQRVAAVFGTELDAVAQPFAVQTHENGALGATIHQALQHQHEVAEMSRLFQEGDTAATACGQEPMEAEVKLLTQEAKALLQSMPNDLPTSGPVAVAKHLVEAATLNQDQRGPVALIAKDMQTAWEQQGRPARMAVVGKILRMLLLGGGGCGKTRIVNLVLTALFVTFWGPRGCAKAAPSNKAARGIIGKTLHAAAKLRGVTLKMFDLRCSADVQSALAYLWAPCGALIIDEAPQGAAALYHAVSLRCTYGRATAHGLEVAEYAEPSQSHGAMPVVVECGDELQLPPVPATSGLFAEQREVATEHMAGVQIFKQKDYVYRLTTMKRFTDDVQISILTKMRISGGCKLTPQEWKALRGTDIAELPATEQRERLRGTELWYQAAPTWATVAMAQVIRSRLSAQQKESTLYVVPAEDHALNLPAGSTLTDAYVSEQIASVPNMNNTGRLPSIALIHIGMEIRLTNTVEAPEVVTDSTGVVIGIDVDPADASAAVQSQGVIILQKLPLAVIVKLHHVTTEFLPAIPCALHAADGAKRDCPRCDFRAGCVAIEPQKSRGSFTVDVPVPADTMQSECKLRIQRRQLPMTIKTASTLHTLQGVTATPGLIFHWKFPRFFSPELRWLATYVALSRPPSLAQLISIGIPTDLRDLIEGGPPEGILTRFNDMFQDLEVATHLRATGVMQELGWQDAT